METESVISVQDLNAVDKKLNFKVLFGGTISKTEKLRWMPVSRHLRLIQNKEKKYGVHSRT